jgi:hypothetical protein
MYIEELLQKKLLFDIKPVGLKYGVFEKTKRDGVLINIGCVCVGDVPQCRAYIAQRRSKQELREEELRGNNPFIERYARQDGVISVG